jgi:hypothetical protein
MVFRRRWHPIWLFCLALAGLPGLSFLASRPNTVPQRPAGTVNQTVPAGPAGHVITYLDGDHLPDTVSGNTTAGGRYLIEVHLSSQPDKITITANGVGFAVQDVNADNLADLLVADGLGGRLIHLENDGNGAFTPCVAREPLHQSGPGPTDSARAADWLTKSTRPPQPALIFWRLVFAVPAIEPHRAWFCLYRNRTPYESVAGCPSRAPPSTPTLTPQTTPI